MNKSLQRGDVITVGGKLCRFRAYGLNGMVWVDEIATGILRQVNLT